MWLDQFIFCFFFCETSLIGFSIMVRQVSERDQWAAGSAHAYGRISFAYSYFSYSRVSTATTARREARNRKEKMRRGSLQWVLSALTRKGEGFGLVHSGGCCSSFSGDHVTHLTGFSLYSTSLFRWGNFIVSFNFFFPLIQLLVQRTRHASLLTFRS